MAQAPVSAPSVYADYCASCHGPDGAGLKDLGEVLRGNTFVRAKTDAELKDFLMTGRHPGSPDSTMDLIMPAFDYLTDAELDAAVAYLRILAEGGDTP
ncbi:MAG: cytochrome c [Rhodospirillaceae bacterium]|nr:cytochrome c [Rhodospirillaceae bacterium]